MRHGIGLGGLWKKDWDALLEQMRTQTTSYPLIREVPTACPTCGHVKLQPIVASKEQEPGE